MWYREELMLPPSPEKAWEKRRNRVPNQSNLMRDRVEIVDANKTDFIEKSEKGLGTEIGKRA
ncbi:hypothetical protein KFK09_020875 [Dendrobium nobile]|uniref:Uncharacterized protein n=1 Tax=Dendrobium nobile TaxID=94219 RepID=A0A8T3APH3_DENNO|nr:hypothetical protein KFK09_020875 [Dendrobium nobile]